LLCCSDVRGSFFLSFEFLTRVAVSKVNDRSDEAIMQHEGLYRKAMVTSLKEDKNIDSTLEQV
jgi:hypothetical protein